MVSLYREGCRQNLKVYADIEPNALAEKQLNFWNSCCIAQVEVELEMLENHPNLQHLDLENTVVKGSLDIFEKTPNLSLLRLNATSVEGDVEVFQNTPLLEELCLKNAWHVSGRLDDGIHASAASLTKLTITNSNNMEGVFFNGQFAVLQELHLEGVPEFETYLHAFDGAKHLHKLILKDTEVDGGVAELPASLVELCLQPLDPWVDGDINVFSNFPSLEVLSLQKTAVNGSLRSLKNHRLRVLNLADTKVSGSIEGLHMSEMKVLNLANVDVKGGLNNLNGAFTQMQVMNLQSTDVEGDLQVFKEANGLKEFNVGDTNVGGDIQVLENMPELRVLNISLTPAWGDIQVFQDMRELREANAWSTRVVGDIGVFANAKKIKILGFSGTGVHGDIGALRDATGLEVVGFTQTGVWGDICAFEGTTYLREVWLLGTKISGDIKALYNSSHLELVFLSKTSVFGSIQAFAEGSQLKKLSLDGTKVDGDIDVFRGMQRLEVLILDQTHVFGHFSTFYKMARLKNLGLEGCKITGTLYKVAASMRGLRILRLSRTRVTGKLSSLASLWRLQELYAAATAITGDIKLLMWLTDIRVVDLSGTNVSGRIISKWVGKVQKLQSLDLSETGPWSQQVFLFLFLNFDTCHMLPFVFCLIRVCFMGIKAKSLSHSTVSETIPYVYKESRVTLLPSEPEILRIEMRSERKLLPALELLQVLGLKKREGEKSHAIWFSSK